MLIFVPLAMSLILDATKFAMISVLVEARIFDTCVSSLIVLMLLSSKDEIVDTF